MSPLLGIDFGTSHACAAVAVDGVVRPVLHAGGATTVPAVVAFPPSVAGGAPPLVGVAALAFAARHPERAITAVKRLLGRKLDTPEVKHQRQEVPYELVAARNGDVRLRVGRRHYPPQDIAAYILGVLKRAAEASVGGALAGAVIAVPADFDDLQRQAIRDAARIAGLEVQALLTEPSAAVLSSGLFPAPKGERRKVIVYDLGGGSFDVSALHVSDDEIEVVASGGDAFLGGEDFDQNLVAYVCDEILRLGGADPRGDRGLMARLRIACEEIKRRLSVEESVELVLPDRAGLRLKPIVIDRERLESVTQVLVDRTVWPCEGVLRDAGWATEDVDTVLLVGGQTRAPRVRAQIAELFGRRPLETEAPELLVAMGAARQAHALASAGQGKGRSRGRNPVVEATCQSIGVETAGGVYTRLIPKGTRLPAEKSQVFSTSANGQTQIVVHLLQGEREMAIDNVSIAHIQIGGLPARARGVAQIEVDIVTTGEGLPRVTARDLTTGEEKNLRIRPSGGLTEAEIAALSALHLGGVAPSAAAVLNAENALAEVGDGGGIVESEGQRNEPSAPTLRGG